MKQFGWADRLVFFGHKLVWWNAMASFGLGVLAALFGGALTQVGQGPGGGWGVPGLVFGAAVVLGLPSLAVGLQGVWKRDARRGVRGAFFLTTLAISVAFIVVAHALDPCTLGAWTLGDRWGTQSVCERFGQEVNIHTRFHLLWHAAPVLLLLALCQPLYLRIRRWVGSTPR